MTTAEAIKELARVWSGRIEEMKLKYPDVGLDEISEIVSKSIKKDLGVL